MPHLLRGISGPLAKACQVQVQGACRGQPWTRPYLALLPPPPLDTYRVSGQRLRTLDPFFLSFSFFSFCQLLGTSVFVNDPPSLSPPFSLQCIYHLLSALQGIIKISLGHSLERRARRGEAKQSRAEGQGRRARERERKREKSALGGV